jgi:hypothetical protein
VNVSELEPSQMAVLRCAQEEWGLTAQELAVLDMAERLWKALQALPSVHPADLPETVIDLHHIQNRVLARPAQRALNKMAGLIRSEDKGHPWEEICGD